MRAGDDRRVAGFCFTSPCCCACYIRSMQAEIAGIIRLDIPMPISSTPFTSPPSLGAGFSTRRSTAGVAEHLDYFLCSSADDVRGTTSPDQTQFSPPSPAGETTLLWPRLSECVRGPFLSTRGIQSIATGPINPVGRSTGSRSRTGSIPLSLACRKLTAPASDNAFQRRRLAIGMTCSVSARKPANSNLSRDKYVGRDGKAW